MAIMTFLLAALMLNIQELDPQKAKELNNSQVEVRGFLYSNQNVLILADEPNLKSCCVGSAKNKNRQIQIKDFQEEYPSHQVVTVQGLLTYDEGKWILSNTSMILNTNFTWVWLTAFVVLILSISMIWKGRSN